MDGHSIRLTPPASGERRSRWVLAALVVFGAAFIGALALRPAENVPDLPISEDAYYAFSVSKHLVHGDGATIDGIHGTNGFQPLFTIVSSPVFILDDLLALRVMLILQGTIFVATGLLLGRVVADATGEESNGVAARSTAVLLTAVLYLGASFLFRTHLNGLETGFLFLLYAVLWRRYQRKGLESIGDAATLGVLAGLTVLARIDAIFVLIGFGSVVLIVERRSLRTVATRLTVVALVSGLISAPWWIFNLVRFGSLMPTSGLAQQEWALDAGRADDIVESWAQTINPWVYLGDRFATYWPVSVLIAVGLWAAVRRLGRPDPHLAEANPLKERADQFALALLLGGLLLTLWYGLSSWAVHFYPRYLAVMTLPAMYAWACAFARLHRRRPTMAMLGAGGLFLVGLAFAGIYFVPSLNSGSSMWRDQVPLVARAVPPDEVVSAGQSGTLGFFRDRVVNLDGKVNPAITGRQGDVAAYLVEQDIRWLCDWPSYTHAYLGEDPGLIGWVEADTQGEFRCYHRP